MSGESSGSTRPLSTEQRDDNDELEDAQLAASLDGCLEPRVNPIGVFVQFVWNEEVLLRVYQKRFSWTYRDFVVTDTNGMEVFQLVGRAKSTHMKTSEISRTALAYDCHLHSTCTAMLDSKGDPILTVSARLNTLTRQFIIRSGDSLRGGAEVARVKSNVMSIGLDVEVVFTNSLDENSLTLIVKGDGRKRLGCSLVIFDHSSYLIKCIEISS